MAALKVGSLFAGIGGIDLAFEQEGYEILWANELDSPSTTRYEYAQVYNENNVYKIKFNLQVRFR